MFASPYPDPAMLAQMSGVTAALPAPPGPSNFASSGPASINVTSAGRYGTRPGLFGGGPMTASPAQFVPQQAPKAGGGMFAGGGTPKHGIDLRTIIGALAQGYLGYEAGRGDKGAAIMLDNLQRQQEYARKKADTDADTQKYVNALVASGLDQNTAIIMAADPAEMAKHIGTHYDQKVLNGGNTLATPGLNGTLGTYTAPDVQRNGADVVQTPGLQGITAPYSMIDPGAAPQALGGPLSIPGLRTDAEQYAASTGAQPGTPDYLNAMQDYTLKDHGPTAFGYDQKLQSARLNNALTIARGHDLTSAGNNLRSTTTSAANNQRSVGQSNANNLRSTQTSAANAQLSSDTHLRTSRRIRELPNEPVAVGPHGERLVVRNGQWVNSATGQPAR